MSFSQIRVALNLSMKRPIQTLVTDLLFLCTEMRKLWQARKTNWWSSRTKGVSSLPINLTVGPLARHSELPIRRFPEKPFALPRLTTI